MLMDKGKHKSQDQIAFHPGHSVFGIDFINDPLLQGRLFSYTDTQLIRLGGPNFQEIAINRSLAPVQNDNVAAIRCKQKKAWAASSLPAIIAL
jgi:catalase